MQNSNSKVEPTTVIQHSSNEMLAHVYHFEFTLNDTTSEAYKAGWEAWRLYADSGFLQQKENPYSRSERNHYVWNKGWNSNDYKLYESDENKSEEYHGRQFEETIRFELNKYFERTGIRYSSLEDFYFDCQNGKVEAEHIFDLTELRDVKERLANIA